MASPVVQTTNQGFSNTASTSHTVNLPSGIQAGDTLVVLFGHKDSANGASFPAGWTEFFEALNTAGSTIGLTGAWRKADGGEGASITVTTVASGRMAYASYRINGAADPTVTPPQAATGTANNTANPDPPNLTPTGGAKDYLWLAIFASSHGRITSTLPTNFTDNVGDGDNSGTAARVGVGSGKRAFNAASLDPGTFTTTAGSVEEVAFATIAIHPSGAASYTLTAALGTYTESGVAASVLFGHKIIPDVGSYAESGIAVSFLKGKTMAAGLGIFTETGVNVSFPRIYILASAVGAYTESGIAAGLLFGHKIAPDAGSYIETGINANLLRGYSMSAGVGVFTETGVSVNLLFAHKLAAVLGSYTQTGVAANLLQGYLIAAALGVFTETGIDATLTYTPAGNPILSAGLGTYTQTGITISLLFGRLLASGLGTYTLTGQSAGLLIGHKLSTALGEYVLTGNAVTFPRIWVLTTALGTYLLNGINVSLLSSVTVVIRELTLHPRDIDLSLVSRNRDLTIRTRVRTLEDA